MSFEVTKYGRKHFDVYDGRGELLAVCVYRKGAEAVTSTLHELEQYTDHLEKQCEALQAALAKREAGPAQLSLFQEAS